MTRIALDAQGGDHGPAVIVEGAVRALGARSDRAILLVGDRQRLRAELARFGEAASRVEIVHAPETVAMDDDPASVVRARRDTSMHAGLRLVADGGAEAFVSAGNSGAVMALAIGIIGRVAGVDRPAIAVEIPRRGGSWHLLDAGANVECRPEHLAQFAVLGAALRRGSADASPRVGVLSNGAEPSKGTATTRAADAILRQSSCNYMGYVEGHDGFAGRVDVVVTDGFTGNAVLKTIEGAGRLLAEEARAQLDRSRRVKLLAWLGRRALESMARDFDPDRTGGAVLVGVRAPVVIAHGASRPRAVAAAIDVAVRCTEGRSAGEIARSLAELPDRARIRRIVAREKGLLRRFRDRAGSPGRAGGGE